MSTGSQPGDRLERALAAFLSGKPTTKADEEQLLQRHPDLADLLAPMLAREGGGAGAADATGERVLGDFRLVRELGRGGMGIVYEAWQRSLDRRVAVKVLAPALVANPAAVARFRREAAAAGRMRHPHVVEVLGFGSDGGEHFFAMQFVDGVPLHDVAGRFREGAAAVRLAAELADALVHAHAAGLVHRDVKPGNVLVRTDGTAMLTDFGVARDSSLPSLTRDGGFVGTLDYASPEQVRGEEVDARTDVWALGVILHELLAGGHPFTAATQEATMHRILTADPPRLQGRPGVSDDLAAIVDRALEKNRHRRYASAAALLADLRALEHGEAVSVRLPTGVERLRRWASREPWRALATLLVLVGVPALTGALGYLWANAPRIEAATAAEQYRQRQELLGKALATAHTDAGRDGLAALGPARPDDDLELVIVRALLLAGLDDNEAVRDLLQGRDEPVAAAVRQLGGVGSAKLDLPSELPDDALTCFAFSELLRTRRSKHGVGNRATDGRMVDLAAKAAQLSTPPRLSYLLSWIQSADLAGDRAGVDIAAAALAHHFPDSEVGTLARARCLAKVRPQQALALTDEITARWGDNANNCVSRALALEQLDRIEEAVAQNRRATEMAPELTRAWANLGATLRKARRAKEAVAALDQATRLEPKQASHWNLLGLALRDAGDSEGAVQAFQTALACKPDYASPAYNLGTLRARSGDFAGAVEMLQRAVTTDGSVVAHVGNLADALIALDRHEEALPYALRAVQLAPNDYLAHRIVARVATRLHLQRLAERAARRLGELRPDDQEARMLLAEALLAQTPIDAPAALAAARDAAARRPSDVAARLLLSRAMAAGGDHAGAVADLRAALAEQHFADAGARARLQRALDELATK